MKFVFTFCLFWLLALTAFPQAQKYRVALVGFYNLENLYDTINNPAKDDEEFLP
ncbi:MAG: hypothetical protein JNM68_14000, partial [Dinghuibacter sp.]|nr:hypothetical protein [Dinghuibacter sp.]